MKFSTVILIFLIVANGFAQEKESTNQAKRIAGTRVSLIPPSGFIPSEDFQVMGLNPWALQ